MEHTTTKFNFLSSAVCCNSCFIVAGTIAIVNYYSVSVPGKFLPYRWLYIRNSEGHYK